MQLTFLNLTSNDISCSWQASSTEHTLVALPATPTTTQVKKRPRYFTFSRPLSKEYEAEWKIEPASTLTQISLSLSASWQVVSVPDDCPYWMYSTKIGKKHYQVTILPRRSLAAFLSDIPDTVPLSSLLLPGTHDTMAFYGWPLSQCQTLETPLNVQLQSGIRVLDIRLALVEGHLVAYHGVYPQKTPFTAILSIMHVFLSSPRSSRETIVMSLKQEDYSKTSQLDFSRAVHDEIATSPGEVRGKVVMFSRFNGWDVWVDGKLGIHPTGWPDSEKDGFTWECENTHVRTSDWYAIPSFLSIPEKIELSTRMLLPPPETETVADKETLSITFFSASSFPLAAPPTIAQGFGWPKWGLGVEGVNSRLGKWLLDRLTGSGIQQTQLPAAVADSDSESEKRAVPAMYEPRLRGWAFLDYYDNPEHAIVPLLVECNFRGRKPGEEGW
ncbi:hypothetical protein VNI00_010949 [Paramarasmius palmivorus]|uniref:Phosphatidylinositol-specific phospholipase C X domain-containing protein n=1 Tax=Paramarasmius palmivorus TaxID=297713 RepID=A0AAW0CH96_9AGAR